MNKEELEKLIELNYSTNNLAKHFNKSQSTIRYWLKKFRLKTKLKMFGTEGWKENETFKRIQEYNFSVQRSPFPFDKIDWKLVQEFYDKNHTWREIIKEFNISNYFIQKARDLGVLKLRTLSEASKLFHKFNPGYNKHSPETKAKLSISHKEYLSKHPEKVWQNNGGYSIPCEQLKQKLKELNINFTEEFKPLLHLKRFYSIDISFPERKIGLEINGGQHYDTNMNLKPYYQTRHDLICAEGWILEEIPYYKAFNLEYILEILKKHNII